MIAAYLAAVLNAAEVAVKCLVFTDQMVQKLPLVSIARDRVLDTVLGPEEVDDWHPITVSRTLST